MSHTHCHACPFHTIVADPDPEDWFNDDDCAIICNKADEELTKKVHDEFEEYYKAMLGRPPAFRAWFVAEQMNKPLVASALRPYEVEKTEAPEWCPLKEE